MVDIIMAVRVSTAVLVKEIIHLLPAAGEQQIMFPNFVINDFEHGAVEVCVDIITYMKF